MSNISANAVEPTTFELTITSFAQLADSAPRDPNGFPIYLLDYSRLPTSHTPTPNQLQAAKLPITSYEGYPSFGSPPTPIWSRLPHEPPSYYEAFRYYLTSPLRDPESITLNFQRTTQPQTTHTNTKAKAAAATLLPLHSFEEAYTYFYWAARARAYDILRPVAASRLRDHRRMLAEDAHFTLANNILAHLAREVDERAQPDPANPNAPVRPFADMEGKELVAAIREAMEMQRTALRLPAKGPPTTLFDPAPNTGIPQAIRESAARYDGADPDATEDERTKTKELHDKKVRDAIASNPDLASALQDAMINVYLQNSNKQSTSDITSKLAPVPRPPKEKGASLSDVPYTDEVAENGNRSTTAKADTHTQVPSPSDRSRKRGRLPKRVKDPTGASAKPRATRRKP